MSFFLNVKVRTAMMLGLTILAFGSFIVSAKATEGPEPLVMLLPDWKPISYYDENGRPKGAYPDIMRSLSKRSGVPIQLEIEAWARVMRRIENGDMDIVVIYNVPFVKPHLTEVGEFLCVRDLLISRRGVIIRQEKDIEKLEIAWTKGSYFDVIANKDKKYKGHVVSGYNILARMLKRERVDVVSGNELLLYSVATQEGLTDYDIGSVFEQTRHRASLFISKKKNYKAETVLRLKKTLAEFSKEDLVAQVLKPYLGGWHLKCGPEPKQVKN